MRIEARRELTGMLREFLTVNLTVPCYTHSERMVVIQMMHERDEMKAIEVEILQQASKMFEALGIMEAIDRMEGKFTV